MAKNAAKKKKKKNGKGKQPGKGSGGGKGIPPGGKGKKLAARKKVARGKAGSKPTGKRQKRRKGGASTGIAPG